MGFNIRDDVSTSSIFFENILMTRLMSQLQLAVVMRQLTVGQIVKYMSVMMMMS